MTVDIGAPRLDWKEIPLARTVDTNAFALAADGALFEPRLCHVGNPHCVLFVDDAEKARGGASSGR